MNSLVLPGQSAGIYAPVITVRGLAVALVGLLGVQNLLLLAYLGFGAAWIAGAGVLLAILLVALIRDHRLNAAATAPISWRLFLACTLIGLVIYALGGEGRFFYANTDWQVRDAVLLDMTRYSWPFVYTIPSAGNPSELMLRAPLGMYLMPAIIGKALGERAAELALLGQNSLMLGALLAAGSRLFATRRHYVIAAFIFFGFSGMDIVGQWLSRQPLDVHLEQWAGLQFSAHLTQAYWVPQHSLAGWIGALFYLLWRDGKLSLALLMTAMPVMALLSPLALMGMMPFVCHAGLTALVKRDVRRADVILPGLGLLIALPALLFMMSGSAAVGGKVSGISPGHYCAFLTFEVGLPLMALFLHRRAHHYGVAVSLIVLLTLLLAPLGNIGDASDFVMRASIPALAILAVLIAHMLVTQPVTERQRAAVALAVCAWVIGLATPITETIRALRFPASPRLLCSYFGVVPGGRATYVVPARSIPLPIRPVGAVHITPRDPTQCWEGPWPAGERVGLFDPIPQGPAQIYDPRQPDKGAERGFQRH